jgi:hypothetical protein
VPDTQRETKEAGREKNEKEQYDHRDSLSAVTETLYVYRGKKPTKPWGTKGRKSETHRTVISQDILIKDIYMRSTFNDN